MSGHPTRGSSGHGPGDERVLTFLINFIFSWGGVKHFMFNIACMHAMYDVFLRKKYPSLSLGIFFGSVLVNDFWTPHPPPTSKLCKSPNCREIVQKYLWVRVRAPLS